jgi:hypothetical protein
MVDPLLMSATASSALLKTFEEPRAGLGASAGSCACLGAFSGDVMKDRVVVLETRPCARGPRLRIDGAIIDRYLT